MPYDWKKTAIKALIVSGEVIVAGIIYYLTGKQEALFLIPILEGALDYLKHKDE